MFFSVELKLSTIFVSLFCCFFLFELMFRASPTLLKFDSHKYQLGLI